jgi:hypothetical protein
MMGDRRMAEVKTRNGSLYVYTHWSGSSFPEIAEAAIMAARPRWDDEAYATRIIVDQLTKGGRDQETGFGLMLEASHEDEYNGGSPSIIIDLVVRTLQVIDVWEEIRDAASDNRTGTRTFESIRLAAEALEYARAIVRDELLTGAE